MSLSGCGFWIIPFMDVEPILYVAVVFAKCAEMALGQLEIDVLNLLGAHVQIFYCPLRRLGSALATKPYLQLN
jgi:uncharacterized membrane protein YGL010W